MLFSNEVHRYVVGWGRRWEWPSLSLTFWSRKASVCWIQVQNKDTLVKIVHTGVLEGKRIYNLSLFLCVERPNTLKFTHFKGLSNESCTIQKSLIVVNRDTIVTDVHPHDELCLISLVHSNVVHSYITVHERFVQRRRSHLKFTFYVENGSFIEYSLSTSLFNRI